MQKRQLRLPLWAKILALLLGLSIVVTILGPLAEAFIPAALLVTLIVFPGPDKAAPRLVKVMPWLWGLSFLMAAVLALSRAIGKPIFGEGVREISDYEIWSTIIFAIPLIWTLVKRIGAFRWVLIASAFVTLVVDYLDYSGSPVDAAAVMTLVSGALTEIVLTIYLLLKFKPYRK